MSSSASPSSSSSSSPSSSARDFPTIKTVRTFLVEGVGSGGDYHNVEGGHWLIDSKISTPMSGQEGYTKGSVLPIPPLHHLVHHP